MNAGTMVTILDHPLVRCDTSTLRSKTTPTPVFRTALKRLALFLAEAATRTLAVSRCDIETPLEYTSGYVPAQDVVLLPVLRAGLSLLDPFLTVLPEASVGYIGLKRDEATLQPREYYFNIPTSTPTTVTIILDPMLATGGSICAALERLHLEGVQHCVVASVIAAPEGVERVLAQYPGTPIVTAALDRCLNEQGYILPGLGDAGDRINGTV